eukprot:scaffold146222_cov44-Attheya_sp.AAC.1
MSTMGVRTLLLLHMAAVAMSWMVPTTVIAGANKHVVFPKQEDVSSSSSWQPQHLQPQQQEQEQQWEWQKQGYVATLTAAVLMTGVMGIAPGAAEAAADVGRGKELFEMNCASCHAGGMNFVKESWTLQKEALQQYLGSVDQPVVQTFVMESRQHKNLVFFRMPGGKLTEPEYADVTTFIVDQATNNKW